MAPQAVNWDDLKNRTASSLALGLLALFCVWMGGVIFSALVILAAVIMVGEWKKLTAEETNAFYLFGYLYIILPCSCIIWLRSLAIPTDQTLGFKIVLALVAVITATDTGAYFIGKKFGYNKLSPSISPNKTWEGLLGGVAAATATGILFAAYINVPKVLTAAILISPIIAVIAQIGDLFKSWVKRKAGVKDSGTLIPGHGGVLDRLDGYMFAAPILSIIVYFAIREML